MVHGKAGCNGHLAQLNQDRFSEKALFAPTLQYGPYMLVYHPILAVSYPDERELIHSPVTLMGPPVKRQNLWQSGPLRDVQEEAQLGF
ncbi:hypothetical protein CDAR_96211 [Caerostris darwini]|uniref:Uncharacterized protein n=1 Tax=Caerostris darwini TaxID=1538125 RepID=A0AAV4TQE9_9ARAC|nr:hypothetical protein CDAR_96211 [Caerostris darwini]